MLLFFKWLVGKGAKVAKNIAKSTTKEAKEEAAEKLIKDSKKSGNRAKKSDNNPDNKKSDTDTKKKNNNDEKDKNKKEDKKNKKEYCEEQQNSKNKKGRAKRATISRPAPTRNSNRATKRRRVNNDDDDEDDECNPRCKNILKPLPNVRETRRISSAHVNNCNKRRVGESCELVCKPGYLENHVNPKCVNTGDYVAKWQPELQCTPLKCEQASAGVYYLSIVTKFMLISKSYEMAAYLVKFDSRRKLPILSAHAFDSLLNDKMFATRRTNTWVKHPCPELDKKQPSIFTLTIFFNFTVIFKSKFSQNLKENQHLCTNPNCEIYERIFLWLKIN